MQNNTTDREADFRVALGNTKDSEEAIKKLLADGYITRNTKCVYDVSKEKYTLLLLDTQDVKPKEKTETIEKIAMATYGVLPKNWRTLIPTVELVFDPHKEEHYIANGIKHQNAYIPTKFLSYWKEKDLLDSVDQLDKVDFSKYPHIHALLKNLFMSDDRVDYFVNWLSYIADTKNKTGVAIILRGIQGTGKGVLWEQLICRLVGEKYTIQINNDMLKNHFNGFLENKLFINPNEIKGEFKDGNTIYEKLKEWITDPYINLDDKHTKVKKTKNYFNMIMFSNNDVPLQIQGSDRRYTVYETKNRTLKDVAEKDFKYNHIKYFINGVKKEVDGFLTDLVRYKYDISKATVAQDTEEKQRIYHASMTKAEILADKIREKDLSYFMHEIEERAELDEDLFMELYKDCKDLTIIQFEDTNGYIDKNSSIEKMTENLIDKLKDGFKKDVLENSIFIFLYKLFVDDTLKSNAIGSRLNKHFNKSYVLDKKRLRSLGQNQEIPF